jgi:hypothetical protein
VPFPIQKILFVQGTGQLISLVERTQRNNDNSKGESTYHLILWQIVNKEDQPKPTSGSPTGNATTTTATTTSPSTTTNVEKMKEYQIDPKIGRISATTILNDNSYLFIGFESGDVYVFNLKSFAVVPGVINKDFIVKNLPDNQKKHPGAVESICHHPRNMTKLLIAYNRGLFVLFDFIKNTVDHIRTTTQVRHLGSSKSSVRELSLNCRSFFFI